MLIRPDQDWEESLSVFLQYASQALKDLHELYEASKKEREAQTKKEKKRK